MEQHCSVGRSSHQHRSSVTAPAGSAPSTAASRFAARYDKHVFSRSLDNPVITRTVTAVPRVSCTPLASGHEKAHARLCCHSQATSVEKALGSKGSSKSSSPAPTFGKRQFASLHNVSSTALAASKFVSSHGSIAASALQELRQSVK